MKKSVSTNRRKPATVKATPATPAPPAFSYRLNSVGGIRREICRLYKAARTGDVPVADASRLGNLLYLAAQLIASGELETRVTALEAREETDEARGRGFTLMEGGR